LGERLRPELLAPQRWTQQNDGHARFIPGTWVQAFESAFHEQSEDSDLNKKRISKRAKGSRALRLLAPTCITG
jgi:hypothetical protein